VQKEIIDATSNTNLAIYFVWMPMVPSDKNPGALDIAKMLGDHRTTHFHDPKRSVGIALERDHFEQFARELVATLPRDHSLHKTIGERLKRPASERPVWDAVLLYQPGAEWTTRSPKPDWAGRQIDFYSDSESGEPTGVILKLGDKLPPKPTGWFIEMRELRRSLIDQSR
jgi:hypothetical protein